MATHLYKQHFFFRLPVGINTIHTTLFWVASEKQNICQDIKWHNRWNVVLKQHNNWPNRWVSGDKILCERRGVGHFFWGVGGEVRFPKVLGREVFMCFFWLEGGFWYYDVDITPLCLLDLYWHLIILEWFLFIDSKEIPGSMGRTYICLLIDPIKMNHSCRWIYHSHGSEWFSDTYHIYDVTYLSRNKSL